jgi:tetratricopeptide (TPR) repeat protein
MMNGIAYATLANISGHVGSSSASLLTRVFLVLICAALLILLYALRGHLVLQLGVGLPALGITTYFVLRAQLAGGFEAPQRTYVIPKAPASCFARPEQSPPGTLAALGEPEDFGYPAKTLDRMAVRDLLIDASYDRLDSLLTAYSDSARRDFRFEYRMIDVFDAFATASPVLETFMDDWISTRPSSANARIVRATYYTAAAWHARGEASSWETSLRQGMAAKRYFGRALADLDSALRRTPCSVMAYKGYMTIAPYVGDTAMSREAMDQALLMQPYSYVVREEHMLNLRPRWGGSYGAMDRLAHDADSLGERNPRLRALHGFADWDQGDVAERHKEPARALELYDHALTFGDLWRFRLERGQLYESLGREDEALADLERALVQRPQHAELLDRLASTKYELGRLAEGPERDRLFYESYGDESLAVLLDPAEDEYQQSQAFYKKAIPEYAH